VFNFTDMQQRIKLLAPLLATLIAALLAPPALARGLARHATRHHGQRIGAVASASVSSCQTGTVAAQRSATFSAEMEAVPRTATMSISFDLYERSGSASRYLAISAPGFGVWQTSNPGIGSFTANENVVALPAPATFRALVHYRWLDRRGRVIRHGELVTAACAQTSSEPDLSIVRIVRGRAGQTRTSAVYGVVIRNRGQAAVGPFEVAFSVGTTALADQQVVGLGPRSTTIVEFTGPRCGAGATLTAQVDPAGAISEPASGRRSIALPCGGGGDANGGGGRGGDGGGR
jgi:CARDB